LSPSCKAESDNEVSFKTELTEAKCLDEESQLLLSMVKIVVKTLFANTFKIWIEYFSVSFHTSVDPEGGK
jgi:hypothetical protein